MARSIITVLQVLIAQHLFKFMPRSHVPKASLDRDSLPRLALDVSQAPNHKPAAAVVEARDTDTVPLPS
jgi:hypothetical protein